jgi:hypothetical protein
MLFQGDFSKAGMDSADPVDAIWAPSVVNMHNSNCSFLFELTLEPAAWQTYGAPQTAYLNYTFLSNVPAVSVQLSWFNKTATRLAEAMWLSFEPIVGNPEYWTMDVLGYPVSPFEVASFGARHLHGVWSGVTYANPQSGQCVFSDWTCQNSAFISLT